MPVLSVVVPIYNVEGYLRAALESLAVQTLTDLEVIMVDDGSTDGSAAIAADFARMDHRFHLVKQNNGGLSSARNTGVRHANGDYLTFVDSDDVSPHYAFKTVVSALDQTGSDFLTGRVSRFDNRGTFDVTMQRDSHAKNILRTTVTETPALMRDFLPHNKIYRRSFWDTAGLSFPEGLTFEDGPVSVRAHALAKSVDVTKVPIYYWRLREGNAKSISQQSAEPHFYVDRIQTSLITVDFLSAQRLDLLDAFYAVDIRHKFGIMYRHLAHTTPEVQQVFMSMAMTYLKKTPQQVIDDLPGAMRERILLTREGDLQGVLETLASKPRADWGKPGSSPVRKKIGPPRLLRTAAAYLQAKNEGGNTQGVVNGIHLQDGLLHVEGFGFLEGLPVEGRLTAANRLIWARHEKSGAKVRIPFKTTQTSDASVILNERSWWDGRHTGFDAALDVEKLKNAEGKWLYGQWRLKMGAVTPRGLVRGGLRGGVPSTPRDLRPIDVDADARIVPAIKNGVMTLRVVRPAAKVTGWDIADGHIMLFGVIRGEVSADTSLGLRRVPQVIELRVPFELGTRRDGFTAFSARLPIDEVSRQFGPVRAAPVAGVQNRLYLELSLPNGEGTTLLADLELPAVSVGVDGSRLDLAVDTAGKATVTLRPELPFVEHVEWRADGTLEVSGSAGTTADSPALVLRHSKRKEERTLPLQVARDGSWKISFHPEQVPLAAIKVALRCGSWQFVLRMRDDKGEVLDVDLPYSPRALNPSEDVRFSDLYFVRAAGLDRLTLRVRSRLSSNELGKFNQHALREIAYPQMRERLALRDVILYDSFYGKQYSDSPRALHELLAGRDIGVEHVWVTRDAQAPVPDGVRTVEANSRAWFEALATSRYVVASTHLPHWFRRREGQTVAQTWHGVGFKRIAYDIESIQFANKTYLQKLDREAPNWSFLISPNSFCTPILRRAFRYEGEICEIGSPRNDLLIAGDRAVIAARVREDLGIPQDKKILLYAPTWRDTEYHTVGQYKFDLRLDVSKFPEELRREYVLLVRRHPNTVDDLLGMGSDFVFDVANHPDVRQLLAAADVLISDYSTIALDFANTRRPILFYTYDLEHYRDQLRGFYFDLENDGPGPILQTTEEVVAALSDLDVVSEQYRERYDAIRQTFGHAEDGRATERFAARLLGDRYTP